MTMAMVKCSARSIHVQVYKQQEIEPDMKIHRLSLTLTIVL